MSTLLQINASLFSNQGQSSQLADRFVATWQNGNHAARVISRDLAQESVPHLDGARFLAFTTSAQERSPEQQQVVNYSDALIEEWRQASVIVLGLPMYNLGIPSTLKAYFDHIARAGETFRYTENGPQGLLTGKKAYIFAARGGRYVGTPLDSQTDYVRGFLGLIGVTEVEFVYAEGLNMGDEARTTAIDAAHRELERLAA